MINLSNYFSIAGILLFSIMNLSAQHAPLKIAVIGLTHTHVHWIFESEKHGAFEIVGIVEANTELAQRYASQHGFSMSKVYPNSEALLAELRPEAVAAFGSIFEHLSVVETYAPLGIHVMVEKPLAVSLEHAQKMKALANKHQIHLLTNYETTWYPSNHKAYELIKEKALIGDIRKMIVRDGHKGPKKIGINQEFLDWLTDPDLNGGGAIIDFGCYGANLATWLMDGKRPISVTAITQQLQAENNPRVDDEAIIVLAYEEGNAIIQASWNWPMGRKDMEIYGLEGAIYADNRHTLRVRIAEGYDGFEETTYELEERGHPHNDPFAFFAAVIKGQVTLPPNGLSGLDNNMIVMEILDAALKSARTNQTVLLATE
jgi:predicted dehydrogenase